MDIMWIIIFILYMAYRAFSESQKKQARAQRRRVETNENPGTRHYRYEDVEPHQELPWDFDPDQYKKETLNTYRVRLVEDQPVKPVNKYQKHLHEIDDKVKNKAKRNTEEPETTISKGRNFDLDQESLMTAIIMSEVLQPPRSKRPIR